MVGYARAVMVVGSKRRKSCVWRYQGMRAGDGDGMEKRMKRVLSDKGHHITHRLCVPRLWVHDDPLSSHINRPTSSKHTGDSTVSRLRALCLLSSCPALNLRGAQMTCPLQNARCAMALQPWTKSPLFLFLSPSPSLLARNEGGVGLLLLGAEEDSIAAGRRRGE